MLGWPYGPYMLGPYAGLAIWARICWAHMLGWPYAGLAICWAGHMGRICWAGHMGPYMLGPYAGLAIWARICWAHMLGWPYAGLAICWAGHMLGWPYGYHLLQVNMVLCIQQPRQGGGRDCSPLNTRSYGLLTCYHCWYYTDVMQE